MALWGTDVLAAEDNKKAAPSSAKASRASKAGSKGKGAARDANVGNALRSVYQQTVNEDVPSEFIDLLGKLK